MSEQKQDKRKSAPSEAQENPGKAPEFIMTDEMKTFADFYAMAKGETLPTETREQQRDFMLDYQHWVAGGKQRPTLDLAKGQPPIVWQLYRVKSLGFQYIYWCDTKGKMHDKITDPNTHKLSYSVPFTKEEGERLANDAELRSHNPTFHFVDRDGRTYSVSKNDFYMRDFDEVVSEHHQRRYNF